MKTEDWPLRLGRTDDTMMTLARVLHERGVPGTGL